MVYKRFSTYLQDKYNTKVYKLPVKLDGTCPNRDGKIAKGGCKFCGAEGGSFGNRDSHMPIKEQLQLNKDLMVKKYKAEKFIVYFQNFTNTYMSLENFKDSIKEALIDDLVAIYISTRPDCISDEQLDFLKEIEEVTGLDIVIELGLQSVNYKILKNLNRGHSLAEFIDSVLRIKARGFEICAHMIIGLPNEDMDDIVEGAKILSALKVDQVKLHALYLVKGTAYGDLYESGKLKMITREEYEERVINFLRWLDPNIVIQRIIGRSDEGESLFSNWSRSWWAIHDSIIETMEENSWSQGDFFTYLSPIRVEGKNHD